MLTAKDYRQLEWEISRLYEDIESDLVRQVCRYLSMNNNEIDIGNWRLRKLSGLGVMQKSLEKILSSDTKSMESDLEDVIKRTWEANNATDGKILAAINKHRHNGSKVVVETSATQDRLIASVIANARKAINLTNTKAEQACLSNFTSAINKAYLSVYEGADTLDNAVWKASQKLARQGVTVATYESGSQYTIGIDAAVRRNVVTSVAQATAERSITVTKENGLNLVKVSEHVGARPEHFRWQGKVFTLEDSPVTINGHVYLPLTYDQDSGGTSYGQADGLCGCNCRHHFFPWVEGFEPAQYGIEEVTAQENKEIYDATQKQRGYERGVRSWKRTAQVAKDQNRPADVVKANVMVRDYQSKLRDLCERYDLPRQYPRERV